MEKVVCVTHLCTQSNAITKIVKKHWPLVQLIGITKDLPLFSFKKGRNFKYHLVRAD